MRSVQAQPKRISTPIFEQVLFDGGVDFLRLFGAEVADRAVDELQAGLDRALADLLDGVLFAHALDVLVRAEFEVDRVGVVDQGLREIVADELRQVAADLGREGELAVRKRAAPEKPVVMWQ